MNICLVYFFVFTPYFCLYLNFTFTDFGLHEQDHVMDHKKGGVNIYFFIIWPESVQGAPARRHPV